VSLTSSRHAPWAGALSPREPRHGQPPAVSPAQCPGTRSPDTAPVTGYLIT